MIVENSRAKGVQKIRFRIPLQITARDFMT
jgi:hypothetical protein